MVPKLLKSFAIHLFVLQFLWDFEIMSGHLSYIPKMSSVCVFLCTYISHIWQRASEIDCVFEVSGGKLLRIFFSLKMVIYSFLGKLLYFFYKMLGFRALPE